MLTREGSGYHAGGGRGWTAVVATEDGDVRRWPSNGEVRPGARAMCPERQGPDSRAEHREQRSPGIIASGHVLASCQMRKCWERVQDTKNGPPVPGKPLYC